jgi:ABC-type phosphate transport system substrate-binding protein
MKMNCTLRIQAVQDSKRPSSGRSYIRIMTGISLVLCFLATYVAAQTTEYKVVTHSSNSISSISKKDLSWLFLKRRTNWSSGELAKPIDQAPTSEVRISFTTEVMGRSVRQVESHWNAQVFSGKSSPPKIAKSDQEVLELVKTIPGAVGYVSADADLDGVKVLEITE